MAYNGLDNSLAGINGFTLSDCTNLNRSQEIASSKDTPLAVIFC